MNDKKDPRHKKNRFTLAVLTVVCAAMILLGLSEAFPIRAVRNVAGTILSPLQTGISRAGRWIDSQQTDARTAEELSAENDALKKKVSYLEEQNTLLSENSNELDQLRSLYQLDKDYSDYDKVAADVISKDPSRWYDVFTINKGTDAGIETGMNVITDGGLVGLVTETGSTWAKVRSIIDDESRVSASVLDESGNCIISGDLSLISEGKLRLSQLNADVNVSAGDRIVTSSISDRYLPAATIPIMMAPMDQAPLYQPADNPIFVALSATPTVEAAPTAIPVILTATSPAENLRPANRYSVGFCPARRFTYKEIPNNSRMYKITILS